MKSASLHITFLAKRTYDRRLPSPVTSGGNRVRWSSLKPPLPIIYYKHTMFCRTMHQALQILLVLLVLLLARTQSRPLDELKNEIQPTTTACLTPNCLYDSKCYAHEEEISHGSNGEGWCHGLLCNDGHVVTWDDFDCGPVSTTPLTTMTPTTPPSLPVTTIPKSGCMYNGI